MRPVPHPRIWYACVTYIFSSRHACSGGKPYFTATVVDIKVYSPTVRMMTIQQGRFQQQHTTTATPTLVRQRTHKNGHNNTLLITPKKMTASPIAAAATATAACCCCYCCVLLLRAANSAVCCWCVIAPQVRRVVWIFSYWKPGICVSDRWTAAKSTTYHGLVRTFWHAVQHWQVLSTVYCQLSTMFPQ